MKKGQVTIFVVMGIILIIIVGLLIYVRTEISQPELPIGDESLFQFERAIKTQTEDCMEQLAKEAIIELGKTGGYLDTSFIQPSGYTATDSNGLEIFPESGQYIPYWYHMDSSNSCTNCEFEARYPLLNGGRNSIETQLAKHIEENIDFCVNDYESVELQGVDIEETGQSDVEVTFGLGMTSIRLNKEVTLTRDESVAKVDEYYAYLDINFNSIYQLARDIISSLNSYKKIEEITAEDIAIYSFGQDPENSPIPPMEAGTITYFEYPGMKMWPVEGTKNILKNQILPVTVNGFKVSGSKNDIVITNSNMTPEEEFSEALQYNKRISLPYYDRARLSQLNVYFNYLPLWNPYLRINGRNGVVMSQPEKIFPPGNIFMPFNLGTIYEMDFNYFYDVSFPVMIEIEDEEAFNGEGYTFIFAYEANIRNNEGFTGNTTNVGTDVSGTYCDYRNKITNNLTIQVKDPITNNSIENQELNFQCGSLSCNLGVTNESGVLTTRLPTCLDGRITMPESYEYYLLSPIVLSPREGLGGEYELAVYTKKELPIKVLKNPIRKSFDTTSLAYNWNPAILDLTPMTDEMFIITMELVSGDQDFTAFARYDTNTNATISLIPGNYSVEIISLLQLGENRSVDRVHIPKRTIEYDEQPWWPGGQEEVDIPSITFNDTFPSGGVTINNNTGYFFVNTSLYDSSEIVFHTFIINHEDMDMLEDLEQMNKIEEYSIEYAQNESVRVLPELR